MDASPSRRLGAGAVGTGLLILFGPGSVVTALAVGGGELDYAGLGIIGLSFGLVVALVIYAFGSTSGAHINPAVTVTLAVIRRFPWREVAPYVVAQLAGAALGGRLLVAAFGTPSVDVSNVAQGDIVGRREGQRGGEPASTAGRRRSKGDVRAQRRG